MSIDHIIIGGGGHALSLTDALLGSGQRILGYTSPDDQGELCPGVPWLGDDDCLDKLTANTVRLINGLGSTASTQRRAQAFNRLAQRGFQFGSVQHTSASVSRLQVSLGTACQMLASAVVNAGATLGNNVLINTGAIVEHHCRIGDHSHIASGATLCGDCDVGAQVHIGAGSTVIQGITIGNGALIASGSVVTTNVEPLTLVAGVPARFKRGLK